MAVSDQTASDQAIPAGGGVTAPPHPLRAFWRDFSKNKGAVGALVVIGIIAFAAIFADLIAPYNYETQFRDFAKVPPAWLEGGDSAFLLGADATGRDLLSRVIYGARYSLLIGVIVVTLSTLTGIMLGLVAGYYRGLTDVAIMRLMDIMLSMPSLLLAIAIVAILGPGLFNAVIAVAIVILPHYVRITRAAVITEKAKDYVTASRIAGAGDARMMLITLLPNCAPPLIVQATLGFSTAILDAAALGFLGLGAQKPTPEWGAMLADAREFVLSGEWWIVTFPGVAILITVLAFNLLGDGLRDALDPKLKQ